MRDRESHSAAHWDDTSILVGTKLLRSLVEKHGRTASNFWEDNTEAEEWGQVGPEPVNSLISAGF